MFFLPLITLALARTEIPPFISALCGSWVGTLEYRDYSDNSRERLGTLLRVFKDPKQDRIVFRYVYDDGPHKVVQDEEGIAVDQSAATYVVLSTEGKETDRYQITGLTKLSPQGFGTIVLSGTATENSQPVDIRETLTLQPKTFTILRESKLKGAAFMFRHKYAFARVEAPVRR